MLSFTKNENTTIDPDWSREKIYKWWSPGRQLLKSIRQYQKWKTKGGVLGNLISKYYVLTHRFWSVVSGADIPLNCQLGGGLLLLHPQGIVIHPEAVIGVNCAIFQQVTIVKSVKIGHGVLIGAGAKILSNATIGDYAKVGANAVVLNNSYIPPKATAVGIPARIILPSDQSFLDSQ
ncbi:serine O-acetyltransferase [Gloeothece verrucosa]|uniref:Serine O-acetyltransferase n=1 Tax=Gloeothece verrucosa (strain PCC 7822) TaxID=497965 RepID=E0U7I6_GLOV7|nr:hypothetical protein [Gloeothece verrucosa]ADN13682.1 serine O-acetyltransferase [Gloeothece verrucosa PCC 7822]